MKTAMTLVVVRQSGTTVMQRNLRMKWGHFQHLGSTDDKRAVTKMDESRSREVAIVGRHDVGR
jgi:hypothetical protein